MRHPWGRFGCSFATLAACVLAFVLLASCGRDEGTSSAPGSGPDTSAAPTGIGRVHSMEGDVRIWTAGRERRAQPAAILEQGDIVRVATDAWALLAMNDGATITVRPETELRFDIYRYDPDGEPQQNSATLALVRGALRSITGLIGQSNPAAYQVRTPTATIGIRGTDHEPAYYPPPPPGQKADREPGTYDKVNEGETVIRRATGEVPVRRGQTAFAHQNVQEPPRLLPKPPPFYERHAQVDRRAVERRVEFQRQFAEQHQRRQEQRRQRQDAQKKADEERRKQQDDRKEKQKQRQEDRQDAQQKREAERKAQQDARKTADDDRRKQREAKKDAQKDAQKKREDERKDSQKKREAERKDAQKKRDEERNGAQKTRDEERRAQQEARKKAAEERADGRKKQDPAREQSRQQQPSERQQRFQQQQEQRQQQQVERQRQQQLERQQQQQLRQQQQLQRQQQQIERQQQRQQQQRERGREPRER